MEQDNDKNSTQENDADNRVVDDSLPSNRRTDPHWLLHELNEILEKGMFKNG